MRPDLDAIRARCEAATPGPWHAALPACDHEHELDEDAASVEGPDGCVIDTCVEREGDIQFIVAARTDIPALLAYIADLEGRVTYTVGETEWASRIANADARAADCLAEIEKAQAAFGYGADDGPDGWRPGETAVDALVRAKCERDELRATVEELRARITTLEAMR